MPSRDSRINKIYIYMEKPLIEINRQLFYRKNDGTLLSVQNVMRGLEGFYLYAGWYVYPNIIDLESDFEIQMIDDNTCKLIKEICTTDPTK